MREEARTVWPTLLEDIPNGQAMLDRLTAEGLVAVDHDEIVDGRNRRYYRLTDPGVTALDAETQRLQRNARTARRQLSARRPHGAGPVLGSA